MQGETAGREAMEAESKMDWQQKAAAGTSKITAFLGAVSSPGSGGQATTNGRGGVRRFARESMRGLVNHRPKSCADLITAEEYRVYCSRSNHTSHHHSAKTFLSMLPAPSFKSRQCWRVTVDSPLHATENCTRYDGQTWIGPTSGWNVHKSIRY